MGLDWKKPFGMHKFFHEFLNLSPTDKGNFPYPKGKFRGQSCNNPLPITAEIIWFLWKLFAQF